MNTRLKMTGEDQYTLIISGIHVENENEIMNGSSTIMLNAGTFVDIAELGTDSEPFNGAEGSLITLSINGIPYIFDEEAACQIFEVCEACLWSTVEQATTADDYYIDEDEDGDFVKVAEKPRPRLSLVS